MSLSKRILYDLTFTGGNATGNLNVTSSTITNVISNAISTGNLSISNNLVVGGTLTTVNITSTNIVDTNVSIGNAMITNNNMTNATISNSNITTQTVGTSLIINNLLALGNSNTIGNIFTTGGNVGIGTTNPTSTLNVIGGGVDGTIRIYPNINGEEASLGFYASRTGGNWVIGQNSWSSGPNLAIGYNSTRHMTWMTSGNVGIGTVSPSVRLHVNGEIGFPYGSSIRVSPESASSWSSGTTKLIESGWSLNGMASDVVSIYTPGSASSIDRINISSNGTINLNGNVGIGTKSPENSLHIFSSNPVLKLQNNSGSTGDENSGTILLQQTNNTGIRMRYDGATDYFIIQGLSSGSDISGTVISMKNDNTGFVGIGTSSPSFRLDVSGSARMGGNGFFRFTSDADPYAHFGGSTLSGDARLNVQDRTGNFISYYVSTTKIGSMSVNNNALYLNMGSNGGNQQIALADIGSTGFWGIGAANSAMQYMVGAGGSGAHVFYTNSTTGQSNAALGTERLRIMANGRVGLGISSPTCALDINNSSANTPFLRVGNSSGGSGNQVGIILAPWSGRSGGSSSQIVAIDDANASSHLTFWTAAAGATTTSTERVRITNSGNVGIGTITPSARLHVNGGGMIVGSNSSITTEGAHIQWNRSGWQGETWIINQRGNGVGNGGIRFGGSDTSNNTTEWMQINNNGFVGIGTTDPKYPLHVGGETTNSDVTSFLFYINGPGVGGSITYTGGFSARFVSRIIAAEYWGTSDIRTKTDIQLIDDSTSLTILRNLEPKTFTFIDKWKNPNKVYGFIAQDLTSVLPDAVVDSTDFIPNVYCSGTVTGTTGSSVVTLSKPVTNVFTYDNIKDDLRVRIICEKEEYIVKVVTVLDSTRFVVDKEITDTTVFVYGQEITDFKTVNKDVIAAVTTAALQEIDRQLQKEREKTTNLELQLSNLLEKYEQVLTRLANLESNN